MSFSSLFVGKLQAARSLGQFYWYLRNHAGVWAAYRAGRHVDAPLMLRNGVRLEYGPQDDGIQLFRELFVQRVYTPRWFYRPRCGDRVFDVGANLGFFAVSLACQAPGIVVHCFEPGADALWYLRQNIQTNELTGCVQVHGLALSGQKGSAQLNWTGNSIHRSFFTNQFVSADRVDTVPTISLADAMELAQVERIELLKVDAEGAELDIFEGAAPVTLEKVERVVCEFHDHFRPGARQAVERSLAAAGFRQFRIGHANVAGTNGILYAMRNG